MIPTGQSPRISNAAGSAARAKGWAGGSASAVVSGGAAVSEPAVRPSTAHASATAVFVTSRRSRFAVSISAARVSASSRSSARRSASARAASPTLPAALRRGAIANAMSSKSSRSRVRPERAMSAASPGRAAPRNRSRPIRAMQRFSPRTGATSATVPISARSARSRTAAGRTPGASGSLVPGATPVSTVSNALSRCATFQATPAPVSSWSG